MSVIRSAALLYTTVSTLAATFQLALAAGAPWGEYAMGGTVKGRFPPTLRIAAAVVAFAAVSLVLNLITPSARERAIWAPAAALLLASSAVVAAKEAA